MADRQPLLGRSRKESSVSARNFEAKEKARWRSIYTIYLTNFLNAAGFSIVSSTIWPFLEEVGGTKQFLGFVVAAFSFGQFVGSPYWGYWTTKFRYTPILHLTNVIKIIGSVMYGFTAAIPDQRDYFMMESRLLFGIGAGNMALCNAYVAGATSVEERMPAMANLAASGGLGFIFGPMIGIAWGGLKPGVRWGAFRLDFLTAPSYTCAFLGVINALLFIFYFREIDTPGSPAKSTKPVHSSLSSSINNDEADPIDDGDAGDKLMRTLPPREPVAPPKSPVSDVEPFDKIAAFLAVFDYFGIMVVLSVFETVGSPLTMDEYAWDAQQADIYGGVVSGVLGFIGMGVYLGVKPLARKYSERRLLVIGLLVMLLSVFSFIAWGGSHPKLWHPVPNSPDGVGCQDSWCKDEPKLPFAQYVIGILLLSVGYPACSVMVFSLYSKVLGPSPQGVYMGILTSSGSLARTLGPLVYVRVYADYGPRVMYIAVTVLMGVLLFLTVILYSRLLPHPAYRRQLEAAAAAKKAGVNAA